MVLPELGAWIPMWVVVGAALAISAYTDVTTGRIRNAITFPLWGIGVAYWLIVGLIGVEGTHWWTGLLGLAVMLPIHFLFFAIGLDKAGDAKLMIGVGACLGWWHGIDATVWAILLMGPVALFTLVARGRIATFGAHLRHIFISPFRKALGMPVADGPEQLWIIKGVVLLVAVVVAVFTDVLEPILLNETLRAWVP